MLHKGVLRAAGAVAALLEATGAADVKAAFVALTTETGTGAAA